ncbi:MAG: hypothetical protein QNI91_17660 [Arenicellales bacterium]|nr:hypothetical protein [Arenicellales bacterium]
MCSWRASRLCERKIFFYKGLGIFFIVAARAPLPQGRVIPELADQRFSIIDQSEKIPSSKRSISSVENTPGELVRAAGTIPANTQQLILADNAMAFFGIDAETVVS